MQLKPQLHRSSLGADRAGADIMPIGRSFLSTDPAASAAFFLKYFKATKVEVPSCEAAEKTVVQVETGPGAKAIFGFVKADVLPAMKGDMNPQSLVPLMSEAVSDVFSGKDEGKYISWIDSHDGFNNTYFDFTQALADGVDVGIFDWTATPPILGITRVLVPHTLFTFEIIVHKELLEPYNLPYYEAEDCRDDLSMPSNKDIFNGNQPWFKTTFMSADPEAAANWSIAVLGAEAFSAPYPWPPVEGCTAAKWVLFPEQQYMMHFVLSSEDLQGKEGSVGDFRDQLELFREKTEGAFDQYMLNSVILRVGSLDPYVERLKAQGLTYMVYKSEGEFMLFTEIPKNAMTVQLRSQQYTGAESQVEELCAQSFGAML